MAWASILIAVRIPLPARFHSPNGIRRLGGLTIAMFAAQILGAPIPFWVPLVFFAAGLAVLVVVSLRSTESTRAPR